MHHFANKSTDSEVKDGLAFRRPRTLFRRVIRSLWHTLVEFWDAVILINYFLLLMVLFPVLSPSTAITLFFILALLITAFLTRRVVRIFGDNWHFVRAKLGQRPPKAAPRYIKRLFDGYAGEFDNHLLVDLNYRVPNLIIEAVSDLHLPKDTRVVDLGCGSGLCGPLIEPFATYLVGVDMSRGMLRRASDKRCYDELIESDIVAYLASKSDTYDLAISADVLVYIGDLTEVVEKTFAALHPGGYFVFSVETCVGDTWELTKTGRYAHPQQYVQDLADKAGFITTSVELNDIRNNFDEPVEGDIWVLQKPKKGG